MNADELRQEAEALGVPVSSDIEVLRTAVSAEGGRRWKAENKDFITAHNAWVDKHGLPLEHYQLF